MAQYEHLPIYKKAMDMAVYIENLVRGFSRYHKYTLGTELRQLSHAILRLIIQANSQRQRHATLVALRDTVEALKVTLRLCKEVKAFGNFRSFAKAIEEAIGLSRQSEGWLKSVKGDA
jgi:hypothetical protein